MAELPRDPTKEHLLALAMDIDTGAGLTLYGEYKGSFGLHQLSPEEKRWIAMALRYWGHRKEEGRRPPRGRRPTR